MACCVPNCTSGYKTNPEKVSTFKVPVDPETQERWRKAISFSRQDKTLSSRDRVCEKHFQKTEVIKEWTSEYNGVKLMTVPRRSKLVPQAIPSIFPTCPVPKVTEKRKCPAIRENKAIPTKKTKTTAKVGDVSAVFSDQEIRSIAHCSSDQLTGEEKDLTTTAEVTDVSAALSDQEIRSIAHCSSDQLTGEEILTSNVDESRKRFGFKQFVSLCSTIALPSTSWTVHSSSLKAVDMIAYSDFKLCNLNRPPQTTKQLCFTHDANGGLVFTVFVLNVKIPAERLGQQFMKPITGIEDIQSCVHALHEKILCIGGPKATEYKNIRPETSYKDKLGVWRHKRCLLLCDGARAQCQFCASVSTTLRLHCSRKNKQTDPKRIRLCVGLSHRQKAAVNELRKTKKALTRKLRNCKHQNASLIAKITKLNSEISKISDASLQDKVESLNLSSAQKLVIFEIVS